MSEAHAEARQALCPQVQGDEGLEELGGLEDVGFGGGDESGKTPPQEGGGEQQEEPSCSESQGFPLCFLPSLLGPERPALRFHY